MVLTQGFLPVLSGLYQLVLLWIVETEPEQGRNGILLIDAHVH